MLVGQRETVTRVLATIELRIQRGDEPPVPPPPQRPMVERRDEAAFAEAGGAGGAAAMAGAAVATAAPWGKTPRNAPCPCGSGKKYKHCHGKI
jgi:preprotein translocase subunit SecA